MKIQTLGWTLALACLFVFAASAADVTGKWVAEFTTPDGQTRQSTMNFKVDGDKLTGTVSGRQSDAQIQDGKVSGDEISFFVIRNFGGNEFKMTYKGKVSGNEIKFDVEAGERSFQMTAKRSSS